MQMNSQNKLPTSYLPVAFLKICLNSWSVTEAVLKPLPCCVKPMFWWNLVTTEGTELPLCYHLTFSLSSVSRWRWDQALLLKTFCVSATRLASHHNN